MAETQDGGNMCKMWLMVETHAKWSTGQTHEPWRTRQRTAADLNMGHGLQHIHAEIRPPWTSKTDAGQQTPKRCRICSRELLNTMGPSDSRSDEIFLKWSLRTACSLRATTNSILMCRTVDACEMGLKVKTSGVQWHKTEDSEMDHMARMREMQFTRLRRGQQNGTSMRELQGPCTEMWPQWTS